MIHENIHYENMYRWIILFIYKIESNTNKDHNLQLYKDILEILTLFCIFLYLKKEIKSVSWYRRNYEDLRKLSATL